MTYQWKLNNTDVCNLGLDSLTLSLRAGGPDALEWAYQRDTSGVAPFNIHDDVLLDYLEFNEEGEVTLTRTMFNGRVIAVQAKDAGASSGWTVNAINGWGDLRRVVMTQDWKSWDPASESLVSRDVPRVVLGLSDSGGYSDTGEIIAEIVLHAQSKGAKLSEGTISPSLVIPPTEVVDTMCDAALRQILAYHPDMVAWIEGTAMNVRPPGSLPVIEVDPCADGLNVVCDPQTQEIPGGVVLVWEQTHDVDGEQRIERIHSTAGSTSGWPPPIYMTIPLAGASVTTKRQVIETRTLPVAGETSAVRAKQFMKGLIPQLAEADTDDLFISAYDLSFADTALDELDESGEEVKPHEKTTDRGSDEPEDFPRMLVAGQVQPWFPENIKQYDAVLKAKIHYRGSDPEIRRYVRAGLEINEQIAITNALPKTYQVTDSISLAETPLIGLAEAYWAAISGSRDEGNISGSFRPEHINIRPGRRIKVTGYFSSPAPVREASYSILDGAFSASFGGSEYRDPKSIADLARTMARNAPSWKRPEERTEALADTGSGSGPITEGAKASVQCIAPYRPPLRLWDMEVTDDVTGGVRIANPGQVRRTMALDGSGLVDVDAVDSDFSPQPGQFLVLEYEPSLATTLKLVDEWAGWPMPIDTEEVNGLWVMTKGYHVLWAFESASNEVDAIKIKDGLYAVKWGFDAHLIFTKSWMEDKDAHVIPVYELLPAQAGQKTP